MIPGLAACSLLSLLSVALGVGSCVLLWPHPDDKHAARFRREAILVGVVLAAFWPALLWVALAHA